AGADPGQMLKRVHQPVYARVVAGRRHDHEPPASGPAGGGPAPPKPGNIPNGRPPVMPGSDLAAASRALTIPALTAATTRSSSNSPSPPPSRPGAMWTETTSRRPLTLAVTVPPPASPSTSTRPSDSNALSNASRILPAFPIRSASIPSLLNTFEPLL